MVLTVGPLFNQLEPFCQAFVRAVLRIRRDSESNQDSVDAAAATLSAYVDSIDHLPSDGPQDEAWFVRYTAGLGAELIAFLFTQFGIADLRLVTERHLA